MKLLLLVIPVVVLLFFCLTHNDASGLTVVRNYDGDTITVFSQDLEDLGLQGEFNIRLTIIDTPEMNEVGGNEARLALETLCPVNSTITFVDDEGQGSSYGRVIGLVFCDNMDKSANQILLEQGYAVVVQKYVSQSSFGSDAWVTKLG